MPVLNTKSVFKAWLENAPPHMILFKKAHTWYSLVGKVNIMKFLVFQNSALNHFSRVDQNIKKVFFGLCRRQQKMQKVKPMKKHFGAISHCDEIKVILLTLFSLSLTPIPVILWI